MLCHLPVPYPDELIYSVIARYLARFQGCNPSELTAHIFGPRIKPRTDMLLSCNDLAELTIPIWQMTAEEIINRHTLYPYYASYAQKVQVASTLQACLSGNGRSYHRLGFSFTRVKKPKFLRYCPICRKRDISLYGETYWHRLHQLSGVLVCPEHGEPLVDTKALFRPDRAYCYADATLCSAETSKAFDEDATPIILKIASRCRGMLLEEASTWPTENVGEVYISAARDRGFKKHFAINYQMLESSFVAFYGETLLSKFGCNVESGKYTWFRRIISRSPIYSFHPLQHALVQVFFDSTSRDDSMRPSFGFGPWKCPNPYAQHNELLPIVEAQLTRVQGEYVASVKCSCGFCFSFRDTSDSDPDLPVVNRVYKLGPYWEAEADRLKSEGMSVSKIAREMGIYSTTAKRLVNREPYLKDVSPEEVIRWKTEWVQLLKIVPGHSRSLARRRNPALYARLRRHDQQWLNKCLNSQPKYRRLSHENANMWARRDEEWSGLLREMALKISKVMPHKRITKKVLIEEAGLLNKCCFSKLRKLLLCKTALQECAETYEEYVKRRLIAAAKAVPQSDKFPAVSILIKKAGLSYTRTAIQISRAISDRYD